MSMCNQRILRPWRAMVLIMVFGIAAAVTYAGGHGAVDHAPSTGMQSRAEPAESGPHGGRVLRQGDTTLELAIFEDGVAPEYRAWIQRAGKPVAQADLTVTLVRLGGVEQRVEFVRKGNYWLGQGTIEEPHSFDVSAELRLGDQTHRWQCSSYEGRVNIAAPLAAESGIRTKAAGGGSIARVVQVYGRLVTPVENVVQVRARFQGLVGAVNVNLGDAVKQGDILAYVESNDSLKSYPVRAPIDGMVQQRTANTGELTAAQPLFVLANHSQLWAELQVFPGQRTAVKLHQPVALEHNGHTHASKIASVTPAQTGEPYVVARAKVANTNGEMAPGDLVAGRIEIQRISAPIVVENAALQTIRNWQVVFVNVGTDYEARPLVLGASDGQYTEVLSGLRPGEHYVYENSYLIKADILKSGAAHDH